MTDVTTTLLWDEINQQWDSDTTTLWDNYGRIGCPDLSLTPLVVDAGGWITAEPNTVSFVSTIDGVSNTYGATILAGAQSYSSTTLSTTVNAIEDITVASSSINYLQEPIWATVGITDDVLPNVNSIVLTQYGVTVTIDSVDLANTVEQDLSILSANAYADFFVIVEPNTVQFDYACIKLADVVPVELIGQTLTVNSVTVDIRIEAYPSVSEQQLTIYSVNATGDAVSIIDTTEYIVNELQVEQEIVLDTVDLGYAVLPAIGGFDTEFSITQSTLDLTIYSVTVNTNAVFIVGTIEYSLSTNLINVDDITIQVGLIQTALAIESVSAIIDSFYTVNEIAYNLNGFNVTTPFTTVYSQPTIIDYSVGVVTLVPSKFKVKVNGVWVTGVPKVLIGGEWLVKPAYTKQNDSWVRIN